MEGTCRKARGSRDSIKPGREPGEQGTRIIKRAERATDLMIPIYRECFMFVFTRLNVRMIRERLSPAERARHIRSLDPGLTPQFYAVARPAAGWVIQLYSCRRVALPQKWGRGYRTARGSERDKDSTTCKHGGDVVLVRPNYRANRYFSLSPYPARYRSRFCTMRLVSFQTHGSKMTFEANPRRVAVR